MDLQLDVVDCTHILDELIEVCAERITTLKLVNASRFILSIKLTETQIFLKKNTDQVSDDNWNSFQNS